MKQHLHQFKTESMRHALAHDELLAWYNSEEEWNEDDKLALIVHLCDQVHLLHERMEDLTNVVMAHMCVYHGVCPADDVKDYVPMP